MTTVAFNFWFDPLCVVFADDDDDDDALGERKDDDASDDAAEREIENILLFVDLYIYICVGAKRDLCSSLSVCVSVTWLSNERARTMCETFWIKFESFWEDFFLLRRSFLSFSFASRVCLYIFILLKRVYSPLKL